MTIIDRNRFQLRMTSQKAKQFQVDNNNNIMFSSSVAHAVVHLGFSEHSYEVKENASSVNVCFELMDGALTGRPVVFKAFSSDGSAVGMWFSFS